MQQAEGKASDKNRLIWGRSVIEDRSDLQPRPQ